MAKTIRLPDFLKLLSFPNLSKITLYNSQRDLSFSKPALKRAVLFLLKEFKISTDEVIFHFVTLTKISKIHKDFFNDSTPTDCITFPIDPPQDKKPFHLLGESFICPKIALDYAHQHGLLPSHELLRYVVHCFLHLIGYQDTQPKERAKMKRLENACLKKLANENIVLTKN